MSLSELIAGVEDHEKTLAVVNADSAVTDSLREYFVERNVTVVEERSERTLAEYVVLGDRETFMTAASVAE